MTFVDENLLFETWDTEDLADLSEQATDFNDYIKKINSNSVMGLIGRRGTGKSVFLKKVSHNYDKDDHVERIHFDARKYPGKKELWECFVLDVVEQLFDSSDLEEVLLILNKEKSGSKQILEGMVGIAAAATGSGPLATSLIGAKNQNSLRYYELERLFSAFLSTKLKNAHLTRVYFVIEDADRAGDDGKYFMETLKYFFQNFQKEYTMIDTKLIGIVPIGNNFVYNNSLEISKILDHSRDFEPNYNWGEFIKKIFVYSDGYEEYLIDYMNQMSSIFTIRDIKYIIRQVNKSYEKIDDVSINRCFYLMIHTMRYLRFFKNKVGNNVIGLNFGGSDMSSLYRKLVGKKSTKSISFKFGRSTGDGDYRFLQINAQAIARKFMSIDDKVSLLEFHDKKTGSPEEYDAGGFTHAKISNLYLQH